MAAIARDGWNNAGELGCRGSDARARGSRGKTANLERWILLALVLVLAMAAFASRSPLPSTPKTAVIRVERGDTLWSLAEQNPAPGFTTAQTAELIASLNQIDASALANGMELCVPAPMGAGDRFAAK